MGVDYSAVLIVGVRYDVVVTTRTDTKEVTKYNPDTGAPYQKLVSEEVTLVCGVFKDDPRAHIENDLKLDIVIPGYGGGREDAIVGVRVATVDEGDSPYAQVGLIRLAAARDAVDRTLRAHGYTGPVPEPYVILLAG